MQPYIFPYIGQLNLIHAVDKFVFFDDVTLNKKQFTHKNTIIINDKHYNFSIPIKHKSQNKLIKDTFIVDIEKFKNELLEKLSHAYNKSKYFKQGIDYVDTVLSFNSNLISDFAIYSITQFFDFLDIEKKFYKSSTLSPTTQGLKPACDRLISITKTLGSKNYVNGPGGVKLYDKEYFSKQDINLTFINPLVAQKDKLSIIHFMMHNNKDQLHKALKNYVEF